MKRTHVKLALIAIVFLAGAVVFSALQTTETRAGGSVILSLPPAHLDILSAGIHEVPRDYNFHQRDDVPTRQVVLTLTLAGAPVCDGTTPFLVYGFLIDKDMDVATGVADPAFGDLGIDARICATCNPGDGSFTSPLGPVTVTTDPGTGQTTIEILTTVAMLPSIEFDWIAFVQEGSVFYRLPALPDYQSWSIRERARE
jgi:hypothetical protein